MKDDDPFPNCRGQSGASKLKRRHPSITVRREPTEDSTMGIDQNKIRLTGENSFLTLSETEGGDPTARNSHWRIHLSPKGSGHVLFTRSQFTNGEPRIYSDNAALARWLQEGVQASMGDTFAGCSLPIVEADFWKKGDTLTFWSEYIQTPDELITLTWYDFREPVFFESPPGEKEGQPHGVYSILVPATRAQMTVDGAVAEGQAHPRELESATISSCCLALSETWTIPRDHEWANE